MKKVKSAHCGSRALESYESQELDRLLLSSLVELLVNKDGNDDNFVQDLGGLLLTSLVERISYPKFIYDDSNDNVINNSYEREKNGSIFDSVKGELNGEFMWATTKDNVKQRFPYMQSRTSELSTLGKLHHRKPKASAKTRRHNMKDTQEGPVPLSLDLCNTKFGKTTCGKMKINLMAYTDHGEHLKANPDKKISTKKTQSDRFKNAHKETCVYRAKKGSGTKSSNDHQIICMFKGNADKTDYPLNDPLYTNTNKNIINRINIKVNAKKYEHINNNNECLDVNSNTICKTNADCDAVIDYDRRSDTEMKNIMQVCDLVFDKFGDILFDTITSDNNVESQYKFYTGSYTRSS